MLLTLHWLIDCSHTQSSKSDGFTPKDVYSAYLMIFKVPLFPVTHQLETISAHVHRAAVDRGEGDGTEQEPIG